MKKAAMLLICLICVGCAGPAESFVKAERAMHDAIAPEHRKYVEADDNLSDEQKARRLRTLDSWDLLLRKAEGK